MEQAQAPGKTFLLVVGILYIIGGAISFFGAIGGFALAGAMDLLLPAPIPWSIFYVYALIVALYSLFMGIMGIVNRVRLEKASFLKTLGFISIGLVVFEVILSSFIFSGVPAGFTAIFTLILGLILPVLYVVGANKNLAAYNEGGQY